MGGCFESSESVGTGGDEGEEEVLPRFGGGEGEVSLVLLSFGLQRRDFLCCTHLGICCDGEGKNMRLANY